MRIEVYGILFIWSLINIAITLFANDRGINVFPLIIIFIIGYILIAIFGTIFSIYLDWKKMQKISEENQNG